MTSTGDNQGVTIELAKLRAAEALAAAMHAEGLTRKQLAEKVGMCPSEISRILTGNRDVTVTTLARLLWYMGYDLSIEIHKRGPDGASLRGERLTSKQERYLDEELRPMLQRAAMRGSCRKTRRGAAVLAADDKTVLGLGTILGCPSDCYPTCLEHKDFAGKDNQHAEQNALEIAKTVASARALELAGGAMVHLKFDEAGEPVPSQARLCPICLPEMQAADLKWLYLWHTEGWYRYSPSLA